MNYAFAFTVEPLTTGVVLLRIALALVLGGLIGLERGVRSHPAGFRTHILVCVGACLAMLTNQFIFNGLGIGGTDPARIGAQVISGIGFLGVGTIFMAGRNSVKGLTTAAGLWASGAIGLATGIGFYPGAIIAAAVVLAVLGLLPVVENSVYRTARSIRLQVEFDSLASEKAFIEQIKAEGNVVKSKNIVSVSNTGEGNSVISNYSILLRKGLESDIFVEEVAGLGGVRAIEIQ